MAVIATISGGSPGLADLGLFARRNAERIAVVGCLGVTLWWRPEIADHFHKGDWNLGAFYVAVFNWSALQGAFLFAVYAFFLARSEPFIQAVAGSEPFNELRKYVLRTLRLTMGLSVASLPMLVAPYPVQGVHWDWGYFVFVAFALVLTHTFFCFLKVIRVFGKLERAR
jgi:hypothetical protein